jgi:hypothetical protein
MVVFTFLLDTLLLLRDKSALASTVSPLPRLIAYGQITLVDNAGKTRLDVFAYSRPTAIW